MKYLTAHDLVMLNQEALAGEGQKYKGIEFHAGLSVVAKEPKAIYFGHELYPTIWLKAAFILQKTTKKHIFVDGNKRTALLATAFFLYENGYHWEQDNKQDLVMEATLLPDNKSEMKHIAEVLKENCILIESE